MPFPEVLVRNMTQQELVHYRLDPHRQRVEQEIKQAVQHALELQEDEFEAEVDERLRDLVGDFRRDIAARVEDALVKYDLTDKAFVAKASQELVDSLRALAQYLSRYEL